MRAATGTTFLYYNKKCLCLYPIHSAHGWEKGKDFIRRWGTTSITTQALREPELAKTWRSESKGRKIIKKNKKMSFGDYNLNGL